MFEEGGAGTDCFFFFPGKSERFFKEDRSQVLNYQGMVGNSEKNDIVESSRCCQK